ncbi:MAG: hypothetical protein AB9819_07390 [Methanomassiliicoccales archaeon]
MSIDQCTSVSAAEKDRTDSDLTDALGIYGNLRKEERGQRKVIPDKTDVQSKPEQPFKVHMVEVILEGGGYLDDRMIIDATAPDGVRRSLSIRAWHLEVLTSMNEEPWKFMGAFLLQIAYKVQLSNMIRGVERDYGYLKP